MRFGLKEERRGILELEEASAFAFMFGFLPLPAVQIRKFKHNSDRKSKISRSDPINPTEGVFNSLLRSAGNKPPKACSPNISKIICSREERS